MLYDVIIIGGGPGGYQAAIDAAAAGLSVALIEAQRLGGTCLNEGCIPTKNLLYSAKIFHKILEGEQYGIHVGKPVIQLDRVVERKNDIITKLQKGLRTKLDKGNIEIFNHIGTIKNVKENICVFTNRNIYGKYLIIASGSRFLFPEIQGLNEAVQKGFAINSSNFLDCTTEYKKVVIIGCGIVGIEFASFLASIGVEVTVLDNRNEVLTEMDEDVRKLFISSLMMKGIKFKLGVDIVYVDAWNHAIKIEGEKEENIFCDKVVVCTGRIPNIEGLGISEVGIEIKDGKIVTDNYCRTNIERVYAIGDVNGKVMLAHTAYAEAKNVIQHICGKGQTVEYNLIPKVIYSYPEAAWVGVTEKNYRQRSVEYGVKACSMKYSGRFMIENEKEQGICKIIWDMDSGQIKGCFLIGNGASEIMIAVAEMIRDKKTIDDIKQMIFPHPSIGEVIQECAYMI